MNFPGTEFLETESKYKSRKKTWSCCVYHLHKTSREGISRRSRAVTAKKWTKKLAARSKLFFSYQNYFFCRSRCRQRHRCLFWKLPHFNGPREVEARASSGQWWGEEEKPFLSRATENVALQPQNCFLCCHSTLNEFIVTYSLSL